MLSRVFRYGVATVRCDKDVAADLWGAIAAPKVKHFAVITKPSDVGALLRAIDSYSGHKATVMAMRLSGALSTDAVKYCINFRAALRLPSAPTR